MRVAGPDVGFLDWRALSPAQRAALPMSLATQARTSRARAIGTAVMNSVSFGSNRFIDMPSAHSKFRATDIRAMAARGLASIRAVWAHYRERLLRSRELAELHAMDDIALKDIGISRLEIRVAIRSSTASRSGRDPAIRN